MHSPASHSVVCIITRVQSGEYTDPLGLLNILVNALVLCLLTLVSQQPLPLHQRPNAPLSPPLDRVL